MTTSTKIKNSSVILPKKFAKSWKNNTDVFIDFSPNIISIKRLNKPALSLKEMMDKFQYAAKKTGLSKQSTMNVVQKIRKEIYK